MNVLLANARSLTPKIDSLLEYFEEFDLHVAIITESWMKDGPRIDEDKNDLEMGKDISIISRNRTSKRGKTAGGGVLVAFNRKTVSLREKTIRRGQAEIVCATCKIHGISRKIVIMSVYLPPKLSVLKAKESMSFVSDAIGLIKDEMSDPLFFVGGDFNKFDLTDFICDFPDVRILDSPPTRGNERLDLLLSNISSTDIADMTARPPLQTRDGRKSDHDALLLQIVMQNSDRFTILYKQVRPMTKKGIANFKDWIACESWDKVYNAASAEEKATTLITMINRSMDAFFPQKKIKVKSTDDPWITPEIKKRIKSRKRTYDKEHRSDAWKEKKRETNKLIKDSKREYYDHFINLSKTSNDPALYYKIINRLKTTNNAKKNFEVCDLFAGATESDVAEKVADFFTAISDKFIGLSEKDVPEVERMKDCIALTPKQVEDRIKKCRKPKGLLSGDIFPSLLTDCASNVAGPLAHVINAAFGEEVWPSAWKLETVTVIPKCPDPDNLGETRNISCTPVFSKIMEYFLLERLKEETSINTNQFGGLPGSSIDHYLAATWTDIMSALDQDDGVANLLSIDFAKAFNTMSHQACLAALSDKEASPHCIRMTAAFLSDRQMVFKAGTTLSEARHLKGVPHRAPCWATTYS